MPLCRRCASADDPGTLAGCPSCGHLSLLQALELKQAALKEAIMHNRVNRIREISATMTSWPYSSDKKKEEGK